MSWLNRNCAPRSPLGTVPVREIIGVAIAWRAAMMQANNADGQ